MVRNVDRVGECADDIDDIDTVREARDRSAGKILYCGLGGNNRDGGSAERLNRFRI